MKKIIIISGDPNSINSELIYKSWRKLNKSEKKMIYVISNFNLLTAQFKKLKYRIKMKKVKTISDFTKYNELKILDIDLKFKNPFKVKKEVISHFIKRSFNLAHNIALKDKNVGIINCPINKQTLKKQQSGVTEYFASKCKVKKDTEVMLIKNEYTSVSPVTTHIDLSKVARNIKATIISKKVGTIHSFFKLNFNKKPKICILGLNPHNAEYRKNSIERKIIIPTISLLKKKGFNVNGPISADSIFIKDYKSYDVILGMFHDQVLSPFKALFKYNAINITLGLKYFRASPDHGTANNLIGKNKAKEISLLKCIYFIKKLKK